MVETLLGTTCQTQVMINVGKSSSKVFIERSKLPGIVFFCHRKKKVVLTAHEIHFHVVMSNTCYTGWCLVHVPIPFLTEPQAERKRLCGYMACTHMICRHFTGSGYSAEPASTPYSSIELHLLMRAEFWPTLFRLQMRVAFDVRSCTIRFFD